MEIFLQKILRHKRLEIEKAKRRLPLDRLKKEVSRLPKKSARFRKSLLKKEAPAVIAELKRRSPSKGLLRKNFDPTVLARTLSKNGAAALSVLTDRRFFGGSADILIRVRRVTELPLLRKDFILDEYQVWESRKIGADAILLIASILSEAELLALSRLAARLGLDVLFEVHNKMDLKKILPLRPKLIGINNRNLKTFKVDKENTRRLARAIPKGVCIVSESGIQSHDELWSLKKIGIRAVLVGEYLMKQPNAGEALRALIDAGHKSSTETGLLASRPRQKNLA